MKTIIRLIFLAHLLVLTGCGSLSSLLDSSGTPEATLAPQAPLPTPTSGEAPASGPLTLQIWLPAHFDPAGESLQGELLQARLDEFSARHPGLRVQVRLKAAQGTASLLDSLSAASAAAPLALPDLIALDRPDLQIAAGRGLIIPLDDLLSGEHTGDWYDYAISLSLYRGQTFGLPFAGDALVLAYRPTTVQDPPEIWEDTLLSGRTLAFPAADPRAEFTLALYYALGGTFSGDNGQLTLDPGILEDIFAFYLDAENAGVLPFWLTQYDREELAWGAFNQNRAQMVVTWTNYFFTQAPENVSAAQLPTRTGAPVTLADGWSWAITTQDPKRHAIAVELAEFLSAGEFQAEWTAAAGYLPTRPSALTAWPPGPAQALASQILPSAAAIPDEVVFIQVGEPLSAAVVSVLKREASPEEAVQTLLDALAE